MMSGVGGKTISPHIFAVCCFGVFSCFPYLSLIISSPQDKKMAVLARNFLCSRFFHFTPNEKRR